MGDRLDYHIYIIDEWRKRYDEEIEFVFPEKCERFFGHDYARNMHVEAFLASDADIMLFLDADIIPPPHLMDLITIHGKNGWLAAGAPYPVWMTQPGGSQMTCQFTAYKGNAPTSEGGRGFSLGQVPRQGTEWVDGLATGCLMLRRELFKQLKKPYFEFKRDPETCQVIEGEDLGFAFKLQDKGIKFFCDHGMVCGHEKRVNLIDVQNYATALANDKIMSMHAEMRPQIEDAVKRAAAEGYKAGKAAALKECGAVGQPQKTPSGLILPGSARI